MNVKKLLDIFWRKPYIVNKNSFTDRVSEGSGAIFLAALTRESKSLDVITDEIVQKFIEVEKNVLQKDIAEFYEILEEDGFIVSGETTEELDRKDKCFSYSGLVPHTIWTDLSPKIQRAKKSTQEYLDEHFKDKPHLMSMSIELTNRCNERCIHCYIPHKNRISDIEPDLL